MASAFLELTDRNNAAFKFTVNTDRIMKVTDDGTGAVVIVRGNKNDTETHTIAETYAAIKTALGL